MRQPVEGASGVHLWLVMMKAYRAIEKQARHTIEATGLCFSDFAVLELLLHKGPAPVNVIGAKILVTSGSATTAVDRLESRGLVRRENDPDDRRARIVHLTPKGRALIEPAFAHHAESMEQLVATLSLSERTELLRLLKKFGQAGVGAESVES